MDNFPPLTLRFYASTSTYGCLRSLYRWDDIDDGTYKLFIHLLTKSAWRLRFVDEYDVVAQMPDGCISPDGYVSPTFPMSCIWLKKIVKSKHLRKIIDTGLIKTDDRYEVGKKCKLYWIPIDLIKHFEKLMRVSKHEINLVNGKEYKRLKGKTMATDVKQPALRKNGNLITSELVTKAIRILTKERVRVNFLALENYVANLYDEWDVFEQSPLFNDPNTMRLKSKKLKTLNRASDLKNYLTQFKTDDMFASYPQCYNPSYTGRISELACGLQGSSGIIKQLLIQDINYVNMDLKSAQIYCLAYFLEDGDFKQTLIAKSNMLYGMASSYGIPKKVAKGAVFGTIFSLKRKNKGTKAVLKYAKLNGISNADEFLEGLAIFADASQKVLPKLWNLKSGNAWINHAGVKLTERQLNLKAIEKRAEYERKHKKTIPLYANREEMLKYQKDKIIMAFYLQGLEAYIIHSLTLMGKGQYEVVSNQHDGCLIKGDEIYQKIKPKLSVVEYVQQNLNQINQNLRSCFIIEVKDI